MPFGIDDAIAGIGLLGGLFGGGKEDPNIAITREENARRRELYQMMMEAYKQRKSGGYYDPEARVAQLTADSQKREGRDLENIAGATRVAGYRPGDSAPQQMMTSAHNQYGYRLDQLSNQMRNEIPALEMNDLASISGGMQPLVQQPQGQDRFSSLLSSASPWLSKWSKALSPGQGSSPTSYGGSDASSQGTGQSQVGFMTPQMRKMQWNRMGIA